MNPPSCLTDWWQSLLWIISNLWLKLGPIDPLLAEGRLPPTLASGTSLSLVGRTMLAQVDHALARCQPP